ncbi:VOC family protein [Bacillus testis]|uniref:VOC family protein n=1 Tax=Bacillus testis TaxID=1622072 RepID=UPI00067EA354
MGFHTSPNKFIQHVRLNVTNLEKSLLFYTDFLGFKIVEESDKEVKLGTDEEKALIILQQPNAVGPKEKRATGLYHFAILLPSRADLGRFLLHLAKNRYPLGAADHLVSEALYFNDPDGNGIEVYSDRPKESWKWKNGQVDMATIELDAENVLAEGEGKPWTRMPAATKMGHIHLHVADLAEAESFYGDALGYEVVSQFGNEAAFLSTGKYHHHIGINTWNGTGAPKASENSAGLAEFAIAIASHEEMEKVKAALTAFGAPLEMQNGIYYTEDPSGNRISLVLV